MDETAIVQMSDRRYIRTRYGNLVYLDNQPAPEPVKQEPETKFPVEVGKAIVDSAIATLQPSEVNHESEGASSVGVVAAGDNLDVLATASQEL
jgi:hypothetical protein